MIYSLSKQILSIQFRKCILLLSSILAACFSLFTFHCFSQTPNWIWARSAGQDCNGYSNSIAADASGNTYITGYFYSDTLIFGPFTLTNIDNSGNTSDLFLAKYDANGNVLWAESTGGLASDGASSIAVDKLGNIYVAGWFYSTTINFWPYILINTDNTGNTSDLFLTKYDTNGNIRWAISAGGKNDDAVNSIALDLSGNVYMAGNFYGDTLTLGTTNLTNAGNDDIFLTKLDSNGNVVWAKSAGGNYDDLANSVATDASWNIYLAGGFYSDTLGFGSYTLTNNNAGFEDIYLAKYDNNGNVLWAKSTGGANDDVAYSITADAFGNEYLTGCFRSSSLNFDSNVLKNEDSINGTEDIFLAKYTTTGNVLWAKSAGGTNDDDAYSIAVDSIGNSYITGRFNSPVIPFGSDTLTNVVSTGISSDIFLAKYNANGNVIWAKSAGGTDDDVANSVALNTSGNIFVTGDFESPSCAFGFDNMLNDSNYYEIFIAKIGIGTGIKEVNNPIHISVFPNPASNDIVIDYEDFPFTSRDLRIFDMVGDLILEYPLQRNMTTIDISSFASGVYFAEIISNKGVIVKKFEKQ